MDQTENRFYREPAPPDEPGETRDEYIARRTSDNPYEHTNLHPKDLDAMRFMLAEIEVLKANLKGWHDACNALIDEKKKLQETLSANPSQVALHELKRLYEQAIKIRDAAIAANISEFEAHKLTIAYHRKEVERLKREAACPCCRNGVNLEGDPCQECKGSGFAIVAYETLRVRLKLLMEGRA